MAAQDGNTGRESSADAYLKETSELLTRRDAFKRQMRRAIAAGEDIGIIQLEELHFTEWVGTKAALVTEGICTPDQFPDEPKLKRDNIHDLGAPSWRTTKMARGHFSHIVWLTDEQIKHHRAQQRATDRKVIARGPDGTYGSVETYTETVEWVASTLKQGLLDMLSGASERAQCGSVTLVYDSATIKSVERLLNQFEQTVQSGSASWTRQHREAQRNTTAARTDAKFGLFMQQALRTLPGR